MPDIESTTARIFRIGNFAIVMVSFLTKRDIALLDFYYPITFKDTPFVTVVDNNSNNTPQHIGNIDWSFMDHIRIGNINSGTLLAIGLI